jgi:hypothetical protein
MYTIRHYQPARASPHANIFWNDINLPMSEGISGMMNSLAYAAITHCRTRLRRTTCVPRPHQILHRAFDLACVAGYRPRVQWRWRTGHVAVRELAAFDKLRFLLGQSHCVLQAA